MAVPKKKTSKSRRDMRRSHDALTPQFSIVCTNCGAMTMRHRACNSCGYHRGRQIIAIKDARE